MKKVSILFAGCMLTLLSCASNLKTEKIGMPFFVIDAIKAIKAIKNDMELNVLVGTGSAYLTVAGLDLARTTAVARARTEIWRQLSRIKETRYSNMSIRKTGVESIDDAIFAYYDEVPDSSCKCNTLLVSKNLGRGRNRTHLSLLQKSSTEETLEVFEGGEANDG
jgi:hypothetical protein